MSARLRCIRKGSIPFSKFSLDKLVKVIENLSLDIVLEAKTNHRFRSRSNYLERSIKYRLEQKKTILQSIFFLDNRIANYGKYIHRGLYYPNFKSWKPDPFLLDAIDRKVKNLKQLIIQKMKTIQ